VLGTSVLVARGPAKGLVFDGAHVWTTVSQPSGLALKL
jgi:hypothetical protein